MSSFLTCISIGRKLGGGRELAGLPYWKNNLTQLFLILKKSLIYKIQYFRKYLIELLYFRFIHFFCVFFKYECKNCLPIRIICQKKVIKLLDRKNNPNFTEVFRGQVIDTLGSRNICYFILSVYEIYMNICMNNSFPA